MDSRRRDYERLVEAYTDMYTDMVDAQARFRDLEKSVAAARVGEGPVIVRARGQAWVVTHYTSYGVRGLRVEPADEVM